MAMVAVLVHLDLILDASSPDLVAVIQYVNLAHCSCDDTAHRARWHGELHFALKAVPIPV